MLDTIDNFMSTQTTEEKILQAAENEFLRKGFAAARTNAIAEMAGVTHAMLHYYYRTKEKLFQKIIENKMWLIRNIMFALIDDPDIPLCEKIEKAISNHLDFIAANPDLPRFIINEIYNDPERMSHVSDFITSNATNVISSLQKQIDEEASKGRCRPTDARMLMIDILSLNAFPFMAAPLVELFCSNTMPDRERFIAMRKKETIDMIMRKLKP